MVIDMSELDGQVKFYYCTVCGNLIEIVEDSKNIPVCCGKTMQRLIPGTSDGKSEYHIPVIHQDGNRVTVRIGELPHPATEEHHIIWIALQTDCGFYRRNLECCNKPETCFTLQLDEKIVAAYCYCNLHGLWVGKP